LTLTYLQRTKITSKDWIWSGNIS